MVCLVDGGFGKKFGDLYGMVVEYAYVPFGAGTLAVGTVLAFVIGAVVDAVFAMIWNRMEKK